MANFSVTDCVRVLNEQIITLQLLLEHQNKADALLETALNDDFLQKPKLVIHNFLWALSDIIKQGKKLNESLLDAILKIISILK